MNSDARSKKRRKKEERAPGIKDFLWECMIKKIFPSISSGVLVGRNSTLLTQIDQPYPSPPNNTRRTLLLMASRKRGRKCEHTVARPKKGPAKYGVQQSTYTISSQSRWRWRSVAWLGSAGVTKGLTTGVTERVMGRGGTRNRRWREKGEGDEGAVKRKGEEAYAGRGGTGPSVARPSTLFELREGGNRAVLSVSHSS